MIAHQSQNRRKQRRRQTRPVKVVVGTVHIRAKIGPVGGDIRIRASDAIVQALGRVEINAEPGVIRVRRVGCRKVLGNCSLLVRRLGEIVGESPRGAEVLGGAAQIHVHDALRHLDGLVRVQHRASNGGNIWAVGWVLRVEDRAFGPQTAVC